MFRQRIVATSIKILLNNYCYKRRITYNIAVILKSVLGHTTLVSIQKY